MDNSLFYSHIEENELNINWIKKIKTYSLENPEKQIYLISAPLGEKYSYSYEEHVLVILSPKHKIIFIDLKNENEAFEEYYDDFIEDLSYISDKYNYKEHIGRPRRWKKNITIKETLSKISTIDELFDKHILSQQDYRKAELLISLLLGSINDIEKIGATEPDTILDKVKRNIVLFDGEQTRFIYQKFNKKTVSIQGLSGTGKTELLLHKLKELYLTEDNAKIFFTCHNIALANTLKARIPAFFNFMKVEKQIEWNTKLWVNRAWGSQKDKNSGLYSYISNFYDFTFLRYSSSTNYNVIFTKALEHINSIDNSNFEFAFDYILIDERQDFPKIFFELCKKITKKKVFIAGDIFQDIFENTMETELEVDIILNRCYRTDPRTLMFAHSIGLGLFEKKKLNWFEDQYWNAIGYNLKRIGSNEVELSREPVRRFEDLNIEYFESTVIEKSTRVSEVLNILKRIQANHSTVQPEDIAIIILDSHQQIYKYIDNLCYSILNQLGWKINRAIETKSKESNSIYITNSNNVKGLEFPFVICITGGIKKTYRYRNILYTMLTRSFIQSYLLVQTDKNLDVLEEGLQKINQERMIRTIEPSQSEKEAIKNKIAKLKNKQNISYKEFLKQIFNELQIEYKHRRKLEKAIIGASIAQFDENTTKKFINANIEFYN
ncbi:MAG: DEAD/DEAH box helicase [Chitinophagales bacterium]